jgi:hypothetical protein
MNAKPCSRQTLAAGDYTLIEQCSCGAVHVTIGAVTLRLAGGAIPSIATTLGEAAAALHRPAATAASTDDAAFS